MLHHATCGYTAKDIIMRFKVTKEEYPRGYAFFVTVEDSNVKVAGTYKDEAMAFHLAECANLVDDLMRTGLYQRVVQRIQDVDKLNGEKDAI